MQKYYASTDKISYILISRGLMPTLLFLNKAFQSLNLRIFCAFYLKDHFLIIPISFFFLYLVDISIGFFPEVRGVKNASSNSIQKGLACRRTLSCCCLLFCIILTKKYACIQTCNCQYLLSIQLLLLELSISSSQVMGA